MKRKPLLMLLAVCLCITSVAQTISNITSPKDFFGFEPGADKHLFSYEQLIDYFKIIDKQSDKLKLEEIGHSPMGKTMYLLFISDAKNIDKLDDLKKINKALALDPNLSTEDLTNFKTQGKVFVLGTLSMHSTEVGPSQAAPTIVYNLITTQQEDIRSAMEEVVYMIVPNHNPDGMDMIVEHYNKYLGTKFEASQFPGVYHKYVGHDNNRDFITLSQDDTRAISAITSKTWFPQVMVEKHQMGSSGVRYYVPPNHDPIAENIEAEMWNWIGIFGSNMIKDMTAENCSGVSQHYLFDNYWPGSTETCLWKNVIAFLTEAASAKYASPVYVEHNELSVWGKGLSEYKKSVNMPLPWPGGWWRLSDIVKYEISSTHSIILTAARHKTAIIEFRNQMCKTEVEKGKTEGPYYYVFPANQPDVSELQLFIELLNEHGIEVYKAKNNINYFENDINKGDIVVPLSQPFRAFVKEVVEKQEYPERHYTPNGELIKPYDITSWSLPLHMGIKYNTIDNQYIDISNDLSKINKLELTKNSDNDKPYLAFPSNINSSFKAAFALLNQNIPVWQINKTDTIDGQIVVAGSFCIKNTESAKLGMKNFSEVQQYSIIGLSSIEKLEKRKITLPSIGLFETHFHDMDAGWTRYIFDEYQIPYTIIHPEDFKNTDLSKLSVLIFTNSDKSVILKGMYESADKKYNVASLPPEFAVGIEDEGVEKIMEFVNNGGKVIAWGQSCDLFEGVLKEKISKKESYNYKLPYKNIADNLKKNGLYCPGSLVNINLLNNNPLTYGLPGQIQVFYRGNPVFETSIPYFDMGRKVIGTFPEKEILKSGYIEKEELLSSKSAALLLQKGKGNLILFAFNPQFRASTHGSFKLIFNSLLF